MLKIRHSLYGACLLIGIVLLDPHLSTGQRDGGFGGGKGGGGKGGGGGGGFNDPERLFGFLAKGGDTIDFSRMDSNQKAFAKSTFEKMGMPAPTDSTVVTKAQFVETFTRSLAAKGMTPAAPSGGGSGGGYGGGGSGGRQFGPGAGFGQQPGVPGQPTVVTFGGAAPMGPGGSYGPGGGGGYGTGFGKGYGQANMSYGSQPGNFGSNQGDKAAFRMTDQDIEKRFAEQDTNRDSKLSFDEISDRSPLKASFKEADTNQDGYIDLTEYKAYIAARFGGGEGGDAAGSYGSYAGNGNYGRDPRGEKKEELPVAIRYGKLPVGLPSWWDSLDTDKDGQIGLYEWRADGRDVKEFQKMDLDGDGLLAPQEWQRYNILFTEQAKAIATEEEIGSSTPKGPSRPSFTPGSTPGGPGSRSPSGPGTKSDSKGSDTKGDKANPFRDGKKKG